MPPQNPILRPARLSPSHATNKENGIERCHESDGKADSKGGLVCPVRRRFQLPAARATPYPPEFSNRPVKADCQQNVTRVDLPRAFGGWFRRPCTPRPEKIRQRTRDGPAAWVLLGGPRASPSPSSPAKARTGPGMHARARGRRGTN